MNPPGQTDQAFKAALPRRLTADGEPVFEAPWQAQAFAMAVALYNGGLFNWEEWAAALGRELAAMDETPDSSPDSYWEAWLLALEQLVSSRTDADQARLVRLKHQWEAAYRDTPHGQPVSL